MCPDTLAGVVGFERFDAGDLDRSLPTRFERHARAAPDQLAVNGRRHQVTYGALNRMANQIAHAVLDRLPDTGHPARVALMLDHDAPVVAAVLGVLKTGHACVVLDALDPVERTRQVLADSEPALILTASECLDRISRHDGARCDIVTVESVGGYPSGDPERIVDPDSMAMLSYTSGSTGRPKGVARGHRMFLLAARTVINALQISSEDRLTLLGRLSAGQGVGDLWAGLLSGASLHMFSLKEEGVAGLASWLEAERVTIYRSSATAFRYLAATTAPTGRFPTVRVVRLASEPVLRDDLDDHARHFSPHCQFMNVYSMTETGTLTFNVVDRQTPVDGLTVPIGYPISGKEIRLENEAGECAAVGEVGEMVVRSRYMATGYWRDPELTRRRFVQHDDGTRTFRTGDLARMLADGRLEYVGRGDLRVKVRGYRVEVQEVEARLRRHPSVHAAAAVLEPDRFGSARLVAYFTTPTGVPAPPARDLRQHMLRGVPDQMVPSLFVRVEAMPLSSSGKIDRLALADIRRRQMPSATITPPRTALEERLAHIWSEVLGPGDYDVHDDFFVIGGDSLRAALILSRLRTESARQISFRTFLQHSTIAAVAALIEDPGATAAVPDPPAGSGIPRRDPSLPVPLSFSQQQLWLVDRLQPGSAAYNVPRAARVLGPLDEAVLRRAVDGLVERHATLRTTFALNGDEPVQVVADQRPAAFTTVDLSALTPAARDVELTRVLADEAARPFDLAHDVLLRALLVRLTPDPLAAGAEHALLLVNHHIASDARSGEILTRELAVLFEASRSGQPSPLPPLPLEYADFAAWQRRRVSGDAVAAQLEYWKDRLRGAPDSIALPADRPVSIEPSSRGARLAVSWTTAVVTALERLAREEGATLFMVFLAAFQALLYRYTGQDDIVIGSPMSGRLRAETEPLVGFFANTGVFRTSCAGQPTARALIGRVRDMVLDTYEHQDIPFEKLVEALVPDRRTGHSPLVQVVVGLHSTSGVGLTLPGLGVRPIEVDVRSAKFDLTVSVGRHADGLDGYVEYNADRFDASTISRMMAHFNALLDGVVGDPDRPASALPILQDAERRRVLIDWNATARELPDASLRELFAAQAAQAPDAVALVAREGTLTYAELHAASRAVAQPLRRAGVGPDVVVGLFMERSAELVVAMLGIIEAGGAYLPIDPSDPIDRVAFMLNDAAARVVITQSHLAPALAGAGVERVVVLAPAGAVLHAPGDDDRAAPTSDDGLPTPDSLAYVMYTSGSTGLPKGVAVPQRAVVRLVRSTNYVAIGPGDVVAQASNAAFDAATFEVWGALLNGARLVVVARAAVLAPRRLRVELAELGVTTMFLPTALFHQIAQEAPGAFADVRDLLVGGDAMESSAARRVLESGPPGRLLNVYGPTEATTFASWHHVEAVPEGAAAIPIGRPVSNTELFVLDEHLQPVPIGVVGEIYIGGPGLAVGYVGRPELTRERFVPHPWKPGTRLYRTGDRAWHRPDGTLFFGGRADEQLKIRGFRVEPAEVHAAVAAHPDVGQSVVATRRGPSGERALVAYWVSRPGRHAHACDLRAHLARRLPRFMMPSALVELAALPLTPNGKVDRAALPVPTEHVRQTWTPPQGHLEERVADAWCAAIGLDRVGRDDNFFELGGQSLMAVQVVSRLDREFGRVVPAHWLFERPTLSAFAERVRSAVVAPAIAAVQPRPAGIGPLPASAVQEGAWIRRAVRPPGTGVMVLRAFDLVGPFDLEAFRWALGEIVARHEILRTGLQVAGGRLVQNIRAPYVVDVDRVDVAGHADPEARAGEYQRSVADRPYHLTNGPWIRATVIAFGDDRHRLFVGLPHVVYDAVALDVIFREVDVLYHGRVCGETVHLPAPALQYADYVLWQQARDAAGDHAHELVYWREKLAGVDEPRLSIRRKSAARRLAVHATRLRALPFLNGPSTTRWLLRAGGIVRAVTAPRRASNREGTPDARHPVEIAPEVVRSVRDLARTEDVTPYVVLLSAFKAVIRRRIDDPDVVVAAFTANRNRPELQDIVGHLAGTIAVRTEVRDDLSFRALVRVVGAEFFAAQAHADVPFAMVSEAVTRPGELPLEYRIPFVFQLIESLQTGPRFHGVDVRRRMTMSRNRSLRIAVVLAPGGDGLKGVGRFDPRLYDQRRVLAMLDEFTVVVAAATTNPDRRLSDLFESSGS